MIASAYRETFRALIPNQGIYFFWLGWLLFLMLFMAMQDSTDVPRIIFVLLPLLYFASITGSMLTDMLVKPLSFSLPRQQYVLGTILVVYGCTYCLLCSLVYLLPDNGLNGSVAAYASHLFLGIAFFLSICMVLVLTTSTVLMGLLGGCVLVLGAGNFPDFTAAFMQGLEYLVEQPLLCFFVLVVSFIVATVCMSRTRKRKLCGKHFLSFANSANQAQAATITRKIKREKSQNAGSAKLQHVGKSSVPYQAPQHRASELQIFLDDLYLDSHRIEWKKLVVSVLVIVVFPIVFSDGNVLNMSSALMVPLIIALPGFHEFFRKNLSPMLPTSRSRHFRLALLKGAFLYLVAIAIIVVELLIIKLIEWFTREMVLPEFSPLPVRLVFFFALLAPVLAWMLITLRSVFSILPGILLLVIGAFYVAEVYLDNFLAWSFSAIALLTVVLYLPFVYKSYLDCFRRDLIAGDNKSQSRTSRPYLPATMA